MMCDGKPETAFGASSGQFKSMTVRQKFGQDGNEALHGYFTPLWAALVCATYQTTEIRDACLPEEVTHFYGLARALKIKYSGICQQVNIVPP